MKQPALLLLVVSFLTGTAVAQQTGSTPASPAHPPSGAPDLSHAPIVIMPDEWRELRAARSEALQAYPDLAAKNKKLIEKTNALDDKLDAAIAKTNPAMVPTIAKFEAYRAYRAQQEALAASPVGAPPATPPPAK